MTLNQMKYFIAICNEKSFSKAAELLYVTQPAISRQIIALEEELGFPLIKRTKGKGFEITAIGKQYYNLFSRFISEKSYMEYLVQNFDIVPDKIYTVGLMDGWELHEWIESCNLKIKSLFSNVQLSFKFYPPDSLDDVLQKNQLDFAIFPDSLYKKYYSYEKYFLLKINSVFLFHQKTKQ